MQPICRFVLALVIAAGFAVQSQAQDYPARSIRLIVPLAAGGLGDTFARAFTSHLSQRLGQPIVVDNRPGANQVIALEMTARASPDGYTLLQSTQAGLVFSTAMRKTLPYDPLKDFTQITLLFATPFYLLAHPSVPVRNLQDLIALAKAQPGKLNYGSIGVGSGHHLAMEFLMMRTGMQLTHVPYKSSAQSNPDMLAGQIQVMFQGPTSSLPPVKTGKMRALGITAGVRSRSMPDLPTIAEQGVPGYQMDTWFGLSAPAGLPRPIVNRLNAEAASVLRLPEMSEKFASSHLDFIPSTPEHMAERVRNDIPLWTKVVRQAGIDPE